MTELIIVGAGDHGRVVADLARDAGHDLIGYVEPATGRRAVPARTVSGSPVLGSLSDAEPWLARARDARFVVALGNNHSRESAWVRCLELNLVPATLIHRSAIVLGDAEIGAGAQVCAGAVVGVGARIGANVIVNTAASVDHDDDIGEHAFIGPGAHLGGRVTVEAGAHVGLGAAVREGIRIGAWAFVAAGAVVVHDVAAGTRVAGVPARRMSTPDPNMGGR